MITGLLGQCPGVHLASGLSPTLGLPGRHEQQRGRTSEICDELPGVDHTVFLNAVSATHLFHRGTTADAFVLEQEVSS